jgi:hypothetical protein
MPIKQPTFPSEAFSSNNPLLDGWWNRPGLKCISCGTLRTETEFGAMDSFGDWRCVKCHWDKYADKANWCAWWKHQPNTPEWIKKIIKEIEHGSTEA